MHAPNSSNTECQVAVREAFCVLIYYYVVHVQRDNAVCAADLIKTFAIDFDFEKLLIFFNSFDFDIDFDLQ